MKNVRFMMSVAFLLVISVLFDVDRRVYADTDPSQGGKTTTQTPSPTTTTTTPDINFLIMYLSYVGKLI